MSEPTPARVTAEQLKKWLWNDRERQEEAAARLYVSPRTIDNWRTGKNPIPDQYHAPLLAMMSGQDDILLSLPKDVRQRISDAARRKGYPTAKSFLEDWLKATWAILLAGALSCYAARSEKPDPATLSAAVVAVPAARKQQPGTDDE